MCTIYTLVALSMPLLGHELIHSSNWSASLLSRCYIEEAEYIFFIKKGSNAFERCKPDSTSLRPFNPSTLQIMAGLFLLVMHLYRQIAAYFVDLSILMCTITLWIPAKAFKQFINENPSDLNEPIQKYNALKILSQKLSLAIGNLVVVYFLEGILYYSSHLDEIIVLNDWVGKFRVLAFLLTLAMILTFNGQTCKHVEESVNFWLNYNENAAQIPSHKLPILLNELNQHAVGLSGNGLFTVSFDFLSNVSEKVHAFCILNMNKAWLIDLYCCCCLR